jgi:hypothetical protein
MEMNVPLAQIVWLIKKNALAANQGKRTKEVDKMNYSIKQDEKSMIATVLSSFRRVK